MPDAREWRRNQCHRNVSRTILIDFRGARRAQILTTETHMAKKPTDVRPTITLRSSAGTGTSYVTEKNRRTDPDRLVLRKYDRAVRRHVEFRETR
jgi:large subunit ribosomal protein L33